MKQILAIDTTTEACSVAVNYQQDGIDKIASRFEIAPRRHAELILSMVDEVLEEANISLQQLTTIAVTIGPGAFTGVRLGVAVAQGLAFSAGLKIIPVNTLEALAYGAADSIKLVDCQIAVAIDARMNEVYWGCFEFKNGQLSPLTEQVVTAANCVPLADEEMSDSWLCCGTGWSAYQDSFNEVLGFRPSVDEDVMLPTASSVLSLAKERSTEQLKAELISPLYLRDKVAETTIERQAKRQKN